jgi:transcriptional regulator with XRE-family HTH domain
MLEFGSLLRVYRDHLGASQSEMAAILGVSQPVYSRIENGKRPIELRTLQRLADRRGVSIERVILAYLLLDENLDVLAKMPDDALRRSLMELGEGFRRQYPAHLKNAGALGLLFGSIAAWNGPKNELGGSTT